MRRTVGVLMLLWALLLSGCTFLSGTVGEPFTSEVVQLIQDGKTTKQEVVGHLGQPTLQIALANGSERYVYHFSTINGSIVMPLFGNFQSISQRSEMLDVVFRGEIVESHQHVLPNAAPARGN